MKESKQRKWSSSGFCVKAMGKSFRVMTAGGSLRLPHYRKSAEEMLQHTHTHFTYELLFAKDGIMTLVTENGIALHERQAVIVPPGLKHCSMMQAGGGYNLLVLPQFDAQEAITIPTDRPTVLELGEDVGFYIEQLSREWDSETGSEISEHLAAMILHRVFGSLLGEEALAKTAQPTPASAIGMIESYVNGNYYKRITLADLSPVVHLCEKQVARIIKREYGMTLTQLLAEKRVGAAQMLLKNTDLKISEIAQRVSPTAENYFFASFREIVGMSPLQYRKAYRK